MTGSEIMAINDALKAIWERRSIRAFADREVTPGQIDTLLKAAMAGPSAHNNQPWEFVVVRNPEALKALRENLDYAGYRCPAAIIVCGNLGRTSGGETRDFWIQDCSAAVMNLMTAATSLGLGTLWVGLHPNPKQARTAARILEIPDSAVPLACVYVGYAGEEKEPRTQYDTAKIFSEKYGQSYKAP